MNAEDLDPVEEAPSTPRLEISASAGSQSGTVIVDDDDASKEGDESTPPPPQPHPDERQVKLDTDRAFVMYPVGTFPGFSPLAVK